MSSPPFPYPARACPALPHDIAVPILDLAAVFAKTPPTSSTSTIRRTTVRGGRKLFVTRYTNLNKTKSHLLNIAMVMSDLRVAARLHMPLLSTMCPPENAAILGRVDVLEKARSAGLLADRYNFNDDQESALHGIHYAVSQASQHGHADVVRWYFAHWPAAVQCDKMSARFAVSGAIAAVLPSARITSLLEFWVVESGALDLVDEKQRKGMTEVLLGHDWHNGMRLAFEKNNVPVIAWWAERAHDLVLVPRVWDLEWIDKAMEKDKSSVLHYCAYLEESGSPITFTDASGTVFRFQDSIMDRASALGCPTILDWWKHRQLTAGRPLVYSDAAIHEAKTYSVLDWWFSQPDLHLKYSSRKAIEAATDHGRILDLIWWMEAYKQGRIPALDYDESITARTTLLLQQEYEAPHEHGATGRFSILFLDWWDQSRLDLKLPDPNMPSVPSPIDVCTEPGILQWWLDRAKRFAAASGLAVQEHFPYYSSAAIHRASYWGRSDVLDWWFSVSDTLELRYSPHHAVELAAMCPNATYPSTLKWWIDMLGAKFAFRGNLVEWTRRRNLFPSVIGPLESARKVWKMLHSAGFTPLMDGGMEKPVEGYGQPEHGEVKWVVLRNPLRHGDVRAADELVELTAKGQDGNRATGAGGDEEVEGEFGIPSTAD